MPSSMKRSFLTTLFLLILTHTTWALVITGRVISREDKPVAEAVILHRESKKKTISDEEGYFKLAVPESGNITLEIIHPEYMEKSVSVKKERAEKEVIIKLAPYIRQREEVVVTALRYPEASTRIPAAETVLSQESLEEEMAPNIAKSLDSLPGISSIGTGGFSIVPNIRGLARRRVLILIDNARITSDRRTGPNASFVNPQDIAKIEVLRSPSSVFYGSDAIGGVIHILTKKPMGYDGIKGNVFAKYRSINQEKNLGFSVEGAKDGMGFYLSFQGLDAGNYSSPAGEVPMSFYSQGSLLGKLIYDVQKRSMSLSFLGARGYDIGKANRDSLTKPTWYPQETQNLARFQWTEKEIGSRGELNLQLFINPNSLETVKERMKEYKNQESFSKTQGVDYGIHLSYGMSYETFRLNFGADFFGRSGVKAQGSSSYFDQSGIIQDVLQETPFSAGSRKDFGLFLSADYFGIKRIDLVSGIRWDSIQMRAKPGGTSSSVNSRHSALTGFIGVSFKVSEAVITFANVSRAYRAPSLSELFYTGITGRGSTIAQPNLKPETSLNLDAGIKFMGKRFFAGVYAFTYKIDDLIERYMPSEGIYTFGNVEKGRIQGYELETEFYPLPGWKLFGNFFVFSGKSLKTDGSLNDVPPPRLYLGTKFWIERFSFEVNGTLQSKKEDPGPAEIPVPGYEVMNLKASCQLGPWFRVHTMVSNVFNSTYLPRPDPSAVEEPGRSLVIGVNYSF